MQDLTRRAALGAIPAAASATVLGMPARAETPADGFAFEITRSEAEWRAMLSPDEYVILREGGTEPPKSDPLWESTEAGMYDCRGCDLAIYDARWKVVVDVGYLFYRHAEPRSVLMSIDTSVYSAFGGEAARMGPVVPDAIPEGLSDEELRALDPLLLIEAHCRRCGSHLGHVLIVQGKLLHCINGTSLVFRPEAA